MSDELPIEPKQNTTKPEVKTYEITKPLSSVVFNIDDLVSKGLPDSIFSTSGDYSGLNVNPWPVATAGLSSAALSGLRLESEDYAELAKRASELEKDITSLREKYNENVGLLQRERAAKEKKEELLSGIKAERDRLKNEMQEKQEVAFLLPRIHVKAGQKLFTDDQFKKKFFTDQESQAFVLSIDIRRSTDMMLKAKSPELFAKFMLALCGELENVIKNRFGVFDKFTGDGVLAFFPEFFTGTDAGFYALSAAQEAQDVFATLYKQFRSSFVTVLKEVGLGIGIDYGPVYLMKMADGLTIVGSPVVYACRLGSAPAGTILLNQQGYEKIWAAYSRYCFMKEVTLDIKHEGPILCYEVVLNKQQSFIPKPPEWVAENTETGKPVA